MNKIGSLLLVVAYVSLTLAAERNPCLCPRHLDYVCGTDGKTYANECILACENYKNHTQYTVHYHGRCTDDPCMCTFEYMPVCGTDGKNYPNECVFGCAKKIHPELTFTEGLCKKH